MWVEWTFASLLRGGVEERGVEELPQLLQGEDGLVWVDIPTWDEEAVRVLSEVFRFHPAGRAGRDGAQPCPEDARLPRPRVCHPACA